jgi:hypothetical protein
MHSRCEHALPLRHRQKHNGKHSMRLGVRPPSSLRVLEPLSDQRMRLEL